MSIESGVPKKEGTWNNYNLSKLATLNALQNNSNEFWNLYHSIRESLKNIKPNLGHYSLVDMEKMFKKFYLITLNEYNLHRVAGSQRLAELNGNVTRTRCNKCDFNRYEDIQNYNLSGIITCPKCGGMLRPDVVLNDETLPQRTIDAVSQAAATSEVFISIGSAEDAPKDIQNLPFIAKGNGAYLLEISKEETELSSHVNEFVKGESGKILPHLVTALTDS
ncbi:MAG: Sir2 family NAD-dependent protein deacetylase [Calditrichaceae bacterium]